MDDFTLVCGVDKKHLEQLHLTFPTWKKNKPSIMERPMLIFFDREEVNIGDIDIHHDRLQLVPWPPEGVEYEGGDDKWTNSQRYKMLSGFVHVAATKVQTPYMLKLDTDTVAKGNDDWIDPSWFMDSPAIVSHRWGFTKPPDQMMKLDQWASDKKPLNHYAPLNLNPTLDNDRINHPRIISWCAFFHMPFVRLCSELAEGFCGRGKMPVPSQDGYLWYCAERMGLKIKRENMKSRGWEQWLTLYNIKKAVKEAML